MERGDIFTDNVKFGKTLPPASCQEPICTATGSCRFGWSEGLYICPWILPPGDLVIAQINPLVIAQINSSISRTGILTTSWILERYLKLCQGFVDACTRCVRQAWWPSPRTCQAPDGACCLSSSFRGDITASSRCPTSRKARLVVSIASLSALSLLYSNPATEVIRRPKVFEPATTHAQTQLTTAVVVDDSATLKTLSSASPTATPGPPP
jgi:hypothetical protein